MLGRILIRVLAVVMLAHFGWSSAVRAQERAEANPPAAAPSGTDLPPLSEEEAIAYFGTEFVKEIEDFVKGEEFKGAKTAEQFALLKNYRARLLAKSIDISRLIQEAEVRSRELKQAIDETEYDFRNWPWANAAAVNLEAESVLRDLQAMRANDAKVDEVGRSVSDLEQRLRYLEDIAKNYDARKKEIDDRNSIVSAKKNTFNHELSIESSKIRTGNRLISEINRILSSTDQKIDSLFEINDNLNAFKFYMSAIFAALVAVVIAGFFFIAYMDQSVRAAIFSGGAGIQFVTLFSLVIAIILFGIVGILEGKELAALLGGLSGYILGRGTAASNDRPAG
jgi:hypothetical protein